MNTDAMAPCNICGSTEFRRGPAERLSATKRLPQCSRCGSLERHRVVRTAFQAIPKQFLAGARCLQFSPDPALDASWFDEVTVSVHGGKNSLDLESIALCDGSYDWIYCSHVMNHVPDAAKALREMLRVVGEGSIALNVGGTAFNYATKTSNADWGRDKQYMLYGALYADDIHSVLPEAAVLEMVAIDPCSVTLDSVYIVSLNEARLVEIASAAISRNVHVRVFPPKKAPVSKPAAAQIVRDPWKELRTEIRAWKESGAKARFWMRDDDATVVDPLLVELANFCESERVPLALAVIPLAMEPTLAELICKSDTLTALQHGFDHMHRGKDTKSEFPEERPPIESIRSIGFGRQILLEALGEQFLQVFVPPWGTCARAVQEQVRALGFVGYSGSGTIGQIHRRGTLPSGLSLASAHVSINRTKPDGGGQPVPEVRVLDTLRSVVRAIRQDRRDNDEPIGIMTHHWGVDESVRSFLKRFFDETRDAGASWVTARDLFVPEEAVSVVAASPALL